MSASPLPEPEEEVDPELPLPTLEVQPSMLAVDLSLGPGESRTCELHRGRIAMRSATVHV